MHYCGLKEPYMVFFWAVSDAHSSGPVSSRYLKGLFMLAFAMFALLHKQLRDQQCHVCIVPISKIIELAGQACQSLHSLPKKAWERHKHFAVIRGSFPGTSWVHVCLWWGRDLRALPCYPKWQKLWGKTILWLIGHFGSHSVQLTAPSGNYHPLLKTDLSFVYILTLKTNYVMTAWEGKSLLRWQSNKWILASWAMCRCSFLHLSPHSLCLCATILLTFLLSTHLISASTVTSPHKQELYNWHMHFSGALFMHCSSICLVLYAHIQQNLWTSGQSRKQGLSLALAIFPHPSPTKNHT